MSAIGISSISDLTSAYRLYGVCNDCYRMEQLNLMRLSRDLGPGYAIARVRTRLRCSACDSRDCGIRIVWAGKA